MIGGNWRFSDEVAYVGYPTWNILHLILEDKVTLAIILYIHVVVVGTSAVVVRSRSNGL